MAALQARPASPLPIPYEEKVMHPAMPAGIITSGQMDIAADGSLLRRQEVPEAETAEIGRHFITIRREGYENNLPIPGELAPLLSLLRSIVEGTAPDIKAYDTSLSANADGWALRLIPKSGGGALSLRGCGTRLDGLDFEPKELERREIRFLSRP